MDKEVPMLVLSRRNGESLVLTLDDGREIEVRVVAGGPCRLAVNAPADVAVGRAASAGWTSEDA